MIGRGTGSVLGAKATLACLGSGSETETRTDSVASCDRGDTRGTMRSLRSVAFVLSVVLASAGAATAEASPPGTISTIAGDPGVSGAAGSIAQAPAYVNAVGSNLYVSESYGSFLRVIDSNTGQEHTIAGDAMAEAVPGGTIRSATTQPITPSGTAVDPSGNVLIADGSGLQMIASNNCASNCSYGLAATTAGDLYAIAGAGTESPQAGPLAGSSFFQAPNAVAVNGAGDVFIAAPTYVLLIATADCSSSCPYGLPKTTANHIYIVAGNGTATTFSGDGGPATSAEIGEPRALAFDHAGDLLLDDSGNNRVRLVAAAACASSCPYGLALTTTGDIYTIAGGAAGPASGDGGPATSAYIHGSLGMSLDSEGDILVGEFATGHVRLVAANNCLANCAYGLAATTADDIYTIAGGGSKQASSNGLPATSALIDPHGISVDNANNLLIADYQSDRVWLVAATDCSASCPYGLASMTHGSIYPVAGTGNAEYSGDGGAATTAQLSALGIAVDAAGDVITSEISNGRIRLVAAGDCSSNCSYGLSATTTGDIYTIAGGGSSLEDGEPGTSAALTFPNAVALDGSGGIAISAGGENLIGFLAAEDCSANCPLGLIATTKGYLYTIAGDRNPAGIGGNIGDGGPAKSGSFAPYGVAFDGSGDLLIADGYNNRVRLVASADCTADCPYALPSMTRGDIYTVAGGGTGTDPAGNGGPARSAAIRPDHLAVDSFGNVLISEPEYVRVLAGEACTSNCPYGLTAMTDGDIYAVAGDGQFGGGGEGIPATSSTVSSPYLTIDDAGNLLVADQFNHVRLVASESCSSDCAYGLTATTPGDIYAVAGLGHNGPVSEGPAISAPIGREPYGGYALAIDGANDLLVGGGLIQQITPATIFPKHAPTNATLPAITGTFSAGAALDATQGAWLGTAPLFYKYKWLRDGTPISGATSTTYTVTVGDVGHEVAVQVTGANSAGMTAATSLPASAPAAPGNTEAPQITGTAAVGDSLTASPGTWSGSAPMSYTYKWLRDGSAVSGATSSVYTVVEADAGHQLTVEVTATNSVGHHSAPSAPAAVPATAPSSVFAPELSGTPTVGSQLTATPGAWSGTSPITYTYQWLSDGHPIAGATSSAYTLQASDQGHTISCTVTASNAGGAMSSTTATLAVASAAPGGGGTPAGGGGTGAAAGGGSTGASAGGSGPPAGNTPASHPPLTTSQKLAKALRACKKTKPKSKRKACEAQAKKRYRPKPTKKAKARKG